MSGAPRKMVVPPKYSDVYTVESSSGDPYLGGPLEVRLDANGVSIRWCGESQWQRMEWYEIAVAAGTPGQYREVLEELRVQAFEEGMNDGIETTPDESATLNYREELRRFQEHGGDITQPISPGPRDAG